MPDHDFADALPLAHPAPSDVQGTHGDPELVAPEQHLSSAAAEPGSSPSRPAAAPLLMGTDDWRARRKEYLGASEIAAVAGVTSFETVIELYGRKTGVIHTDEQAPFLRHGKDFEGIIAGYYAEKVGAPVFGDGRHTLIHPGDPIFGATPDRYVGGDVLSPALDRIAQIKGAGWYAVGEWGRAGTGDVPDGYRCQVTQEMAVVSAVRAAHGLPPVECCDVVRFIWGQDILVFPVRFDPELWAMLRDLGRRFMDEHVRAGKPPKMDGSEGAWRYLRAYFAQVKGEMREATPLEAALVRRYDRLARRSGWVEDRREETKQLLCAAIGEDLGLKLADGSTVKWRHVEGSTYTATRKPGRQFDRRAAAKGRRGGK